MVCTMLLLLGMGFMGSQSNRYRSVVQSGQSAQARQVAMAGIEDARFKLQNDASFPPPPAVTNQTCFTYNEQLTLAAGTPDAQPGSYQVLLETLYWSYPLGPTGVDYHVYQITSIGTIGDPATPLAQYKLQAEVDMDSSRQYCHFTHFVDEGAP
jgi:hypothetical protein